MVGKFIWDSALFSGAAELFVVGSCIERHGLEQENPLSNPGIISSDGTGEKKIGGIDQARIWTKYSLNDDTFGDGKTAIFSFPKVKFFKT